MTLQDKFKLEVHGEMPAYLPLREVVYQTLKRAILNGELSPGQMLSENQIANQLSVSRTPVREALRSLENENLVSILSGRKVIVSIPTLEEIEDIYGIRLLIETEALRKIKPDDTAILQQLESCLEIARSHLDNKNLKELQETNTEFHQIIISVLQNKKLKQFLDSLQETIARYRFYSLTNEEVVISTEKEHNQILDFLKQGETEQAVRILKQHLLNAKDTVKQMFQCK